MIMPVRNTVLDIINLGVALPAGADRPFAVRNISFHVDTGEIVCLLGESGSGKSIIAQTVMGLLPKSIRATEGEVRLLGEDVLRYAPDQLRAVRGVRMSMIFQEPMTALNPVMTCGEQVDEMLTQHTALDAGARRKRILEVFADVKLPEPERIYASYPHQLSGGQRQRIMIAMALILEPALLIADEPTTALDVTTQAEILRLIRQLQREHQTGVLFITHDMGVVAEIADRVVVLQLCCNRRSSRTPRCCSTRCRASIRRRAWWRPSRSRRRYSPCASSRRPTWDATGSGASAKSLRRSMST